MQKCCGRWQIVESLLRNHFSAWRVERIRLLEAGPEAYLATWRRYYQRLVYSVPIFYECQRCTACCRWPGQVCLTDEEISRLAAFKQLSEFELVQQYLELRHDRQGLVLKNKPNGECIFLDGDDCAIQPVKPQQCRDFPNLWNFPGFEKVCHAIPRQVGEEEYRQLIRKVADSELNNVGRSA